MDYRQSFAKDSLLKLDVDVALDDIRAELAENLLAINNKYCKKKLDKIGDVFWSFPASSEYDVAIGNLIPLANDIISWGYGAVDGDLQTKKLVLEGFFNLRDELKAEMTLL